MESLITICKRQSKNSVAVSADYRIPRLLYPKRILGMLESDNMIHLVWKERILPAGTEFKPHQAVDPRKVVPMERLAGAYFLQCSFFLFDAQWFLSTATFVTGWWYLRSGACVCALYQSEI